MKNEPTTISQQSARRIAVRAHLLNGKTELPEGKEGIAQTIDKLGSVQIDPLAVIRRAHHHILWTRLPGYDSHDLHELQAKDRRIFEYWTHALSYVPMADYRFFLPRMRNFESPNSWGKYHLQKGGHLLQPILERIRREGPLAAKDLKRIDDKKNKDQWNSAAIKSALELLFWKGDLMISERRDFEKIYDLTERVLPGNVDTRDPPDDELGRFFVRRALSALGIAREKEIQRFMQPETARDSHYRAVGKNIISKTLVELVDTGEIIPVEIHENKSEIYYAFPVVIDKRDSDQQHPAETFLLSPFDNLISQRERTKSLFGFDYTLECYLPASKRFYGYFVLPILWGENLVGRLDPRADRKTKTFTIHSLMFEADFSDFEEFLPVFANKLKAFADFNGCDHIEFEAVMPARIRSSLESAVK